MDRGPQLPFGDEDDLVVVLPNVSWEMYRVLADARPKSRPKMAFLDGELEVMTTSRRHEYVKKWLARLLEAYAGVRGISADGYGESTFADELEQSGLEPDECYMIGREKAVPDLAIEVVHKHRGVDKMEIYRRLRVGEVWRWEDGAITVHRLIEGAYVEQDRSTVIRGIDLFELSRIVLTSTRQTEAVEAYRAGLVAKTRRGHAPRRRHARAAKRSPRKRRQ